VTQTWRHADAERSNYQIAAALDIDPHTIDGARRALPRMLDTNRHAPAAVVPRMPLRLEANPSRPRA
jgi:hypothetical protein